MKIHANYNRVYIIDRKLAGGTEVAVLGITTEKDDTKRFRLIKGLCPVAGEILKGLRVADYISPEEVTMKDPNFEQALNYYAKDKHYELIYKVLKEKQD